ncbi:hypothetical protein [Pseudoramibacter alactolyticus]|uniref:hypothetical protein n=1 Tax=Pseudoramibacter alactolyticus TaxID=113287 RepID=UPI00248D469A|nr:hypothetical protein [Pseudoramibacter alactolyticus]
MSAIFVPECIVEKINALNVLVSDQPRSIKTADAAKFIGMDVDCYRIAAQRGALPYAIGARKTADGNAFVKTETLPFYLHQMNLNGVELLKLMQ